MRKFLFMLALISLTLCSVLVLSSCDLFNKEEEKAVDDGSNAPKPEFDLETAKGNLEDADYSVSYTDDEDNLAPNVVERLIAYDEDDENYLYVTVYADAESANLAYQEVKNYLDNMIVQTELEIKSIENLLDNYDADLDSDEIDELEDELEDLKKELEEYRDEFVVGKNGKTVWYGTKKAIEKSKG